MILGGLVILFDYGAFGVCEVLNEKLTRLKNSMNAEGCNRERVFIRYASAALKTTLHSSHKCEIPRSLRNPAPKVKSRFRASFRGSPKKDKRELKVMGVYILIVIYASTP